MRVGERYRDLHDTKWWFKITNLSNTMIKVIWYREKSHISKDGVMSYADFNKWIHDKDDGIELILGFNDYYKELNS